MSFSKVKMSPLSASQEARIRDRARNLSGSWSEPYNRRVLKEFIEKEFAILQGQDQALDSVFAITEHRNHNLRKKKQKKILCTH